MLFIDELLDRIGAARSRVWSARIRTRIIYWYMVWSNFWDRIGATGKRTWPTRIDVRLTNYMFGSGRGLKLASSGIWTTRSGIWSARIGAGIITGVRRYRFGQRIGAARSRVRPTRIRAGIDISRHSNVTSLKMSSLIVFSEYQS
jgi:hypothetical protein